MNYNERRLSIYLTKFEEAQAISRCTPPAESNGVAAIRHLNQPLAQIALLESLLGQREGDIVAIPGPAT